MICIRRKSVATRVYKYRPRSRNDLYRIAPQAVSRPNNFPNIYEDTYVGSLGYGGEGGGGHRRPISRGDRCRLARHNCRTPRLR